MQRVELIRRPAATSIVRSIEVIAQSPNGFDDACREAIKEAAKTVRGINSF
jgi:flavin-binding protein dodecin